MSPVSRRIVSVGNSGGGPLWAFYNQQALAAPEKRIAFTPAGRPTKLAEANLVPLDGMVFVSTHLGQGKLLMSGIDPSVTDEYDALFRRSPRLIRLHHQRLWARRRCICADLRRALSEGSDRACCAYRRGCARTGRAGSGAASAEGRRRAVQDRIRGWRTRRFFPVLADRCPIFVAGI